MDKIEPKYKMLEEVRFIRDWTVHRGTITGIRCTYPFTDGKVWYNIYSKDFVSDSVIGEHKVLPLNSDNRSVAMQIEALMQTMEVLQNSIKVREESIVELRAEYSKHQEKLKELNNKLEGFSDEKV